MKVLITGATGFIGSQTAKAVKEKGHTIRLLVRSEQKARALFDKIGISVDEIVVGDITDRDAVNRAVAGCDAVIHTAAFVSTAKKDAEEVYNTNVKGTQWVMDAAIETGVKKIIHVSSVSALFNETASVMNEESAIGIAESAYGKSKVDAEHYVRNLQAKGVPIVITYPAGVIGLGDPNLSEPHFGLRMFIGQFSFTSSTGMQLVDVEDVARAHQLILDNMTGPDRFILGGQYYSWADLLNIVKKLTGRKMFYVHIPGAILRFLGTCCDTVSKITGISFPLSHEGMIYATQWVYADNSKTEKELGLVFQSKEKTLGKVIRWFFDEGHLSAKKAGLIAKEARSL